MVGRESFCRRPDLPLENNPKRCPDPSPRRRLLGPLSWPYYCVSFASPDNISVISESSCLKCHTRQERQLKMCDLKTSYQCESYRTSMMKQKWCFFFFFKCTQFFRACSQVWCRYGIKEGVTLLSSMRTCLQAEIGNNTPVEGASARIWVVMEATNLFQFMP